jgi:hypothetical protein
MYVFEGTSSARDFILTRFRTTLSNCFHFSKFAKIWKAWKTFSHSPSSCGQLVCVISCPGDAVSNLFITVFLNDVKIYEYLLRDDVFETVAGMLECRSCFQPSFVILF